MNLIERMGCWIALVPRQRRMSSDARGLALTYAAMIAIVALICGMAMHVSGDDYACTEAGGHLEFAATASTEECVMPDGRTIEP